MPAIVSSPPQQLSRLACGGAVSCTTRTALAISLVALLLAFVLIQSLVPLRTAIQIGADEGFELGKATLSLKGYHFYREVWNDQPLLHTFLITEVLKHLSSSVLGPRLVTAAFAVLLLSSVFLISHRISGLLVALLATTLLTASPGFLELGSSCMVEIPVLAPAVAGLCVLLMSGPSKWHVAEILAGALFAVALQIKFVGAIYLTLASLILWLRHCGAATPLDRPASSRSSRQTRAEVGGIAAMVQSFPSNLIRSLLFFGASLAISFVAIHLFIGEGSFWLQLKQAWLSHFAGTKSFEYGSPTDHPFEWSVFLKNWDTTIPALLGISFCVQHVRTTRMALIPLAWFALDLVVFGIHKPWWSYYYVHNAVPLCWCAAIGIEAVWRKAKLRGAPVLFLSMVYAVGGGIWMVSRVYLEIAGIRHSPQTYSSLVLTEIERFRPFTQFIYSDEPIYSFHAGIPLPPKLGIIPLKRLWSGDTTNEKIAADLWATKPGVILVANNTDAHPFDDLLMAEYRLVYEDNQHRLYALKTVIPQVKY